MSLSQRRLTLVLIAACAATALPAAQSPDIASEGKAWWAHIQYLADDKLEGRNVGTPGFEKALQYVEREFKAIGLKAAGTSGFRQPLKLDSRQLVPAESRVAIVRNGKEQALTIDQDVTLSARGELNGSIEVPVVFVGYGFVAAAMRSQVIARPRVLLWLRRTFAGAFVLLGARLAFAER